MTDSKRALVKGYTWDELTMEGEIEGFIEEDGDLVPCVVLDTRCWYWRGMPALVPNADQVVVKVNATASHELTIRFGVEIETTGKTRKAIAYAINSVVQGRVTVKSRASWSWTVVDQQGRKWDVVTDGSINGDGAEIVTPPLTWNDLDTLQDVVRAIRRCGARVDSSCGIHIHVDGTDLEGSQVAALLLQTHREEDYLVRAIGTQASRLTRWCKKTDDAVVARLLQSKPKSRAQASQAWYGDNGYHGHKYDSSRYHLLNLHSWFYRGTVEFRLFEATLHAGKVKAYVQLCLAMVAKVKVSKGVRKVGQRRTYKPEIAKYEFRVFMKSIGLVGKEFKNTRTHLMNNLTGSSNKTQRRVAA